VWAVSGICTARRRARSRGLQNGIPCRKIPLHGSGAALRPLQWADGEDFMGLFARIKAFFKGRRKKTRQPPTLGIALGSGGAKGMAHLGALKAFEEEGISFSVATGSSIGSIVGALYAKGFSSDDMVHIVGTLNRREFSKNLRPFAELSFAEQFLDNYLDGDFSSLKIPFAAWATEGETNRGVALREGKLTRALCASSAIPPFFRGVEIDGKKYYDGAFSNAIPSELCRELGAQFVVGVDLSAFNRSVAAKGRFKRMVDSAVQRLTPVRQTEDNKSRGYAHADFMLRPDLKEFSATDVSAIAMQTMYERGYEEARTHMDEIKAAILAVGEYDR